MFSPANQPSFTLAVQGCAHDLRVLAFNGQEALNQPYEFEVEVACEGAALNLSNLIYKPAFLAYTDQGGGVHGLVEQATQAGSTARFNLYRLTLRPHLARLAHRVNHRIFQGEPASSLIARLLEEHGILASAYRFHPAINCPPRDYCVQYAESDLSFLHRLCEEEGLSYHFQHSPDGHLLVFGDGRLAFPRLPAARYRQATGLAAPEPTVDRLAVRLQTRPTRVTRRDHDFSNPRVDLNTECQAPGALDLEDYGYPGGFADRAQGKRLAARVLQRHRADYCLMEGSSTVTGLLSGHMLPLTEHPRHDWNSAWLLTQIHHEGRQPQVLEQLTANYAGTEGGQGYLNRFTAIPAGVCYRPALRHPRPVMPSYQSAVVTGPPGEEIHCDEHGRVKVRFFWDRDAPANDHSSCWLRVASSWAGERYGAVAVPRVGMEVLVTFLDGDPDQPLVSGCLYNGEHLAPHDLPANKAISTFRTLSTPGGGGFNELRTEDRKGHERIFIHAQRDWEELIGRHQHLHVGHERHDTVGGDSYHEVKREEHRTTAADRKTEVKKDDYLMVGGTRHVKLAVAQHMEAGDEIHLHAGERVLIEAGLEITLSANGSFIKLDPSGVTAAGPRIHCNAGGAPGVGSPAQVLAPRL